jgi:hypothetical protein
MARIVIEIEDHDLEVMPVGGTIQIQTISFSDRNKEIIYTRGDTYGFWYAKIVAHVGKSGEDDTPEDGEDNAEM